jgi:hypothetical protein
MKEEDKGRSEGGGREEMGNVLTLKMASLMIS